MRPSDYLHAADRRSLTLTDVVLSWPTGEVKKLPFIVLNRDFVVGLWEQPPA
jgi:hypothetical protein